MAKRSHEELIDEIRKLRAQLAVREAGMSCWTDRFAPCVAQQRLAGILTISEDAIISVDQEHRITLFNQGAERIFQYRAEEVLGQPLHILLPERLRDRHAELLEGFIAAVRAPHTGPQGEIWCRRKDGSEFPAEVSASQVTVGSRVTITVILRDITERLRFEAALAQARDQALEASRIKSAFLANMSHEIRTPMNGIIGMIELLLDTPLDEVQREYAQVIYDSAQSLLTLINDILDFSKIEANKMHLEIIEFEPLALVEGVAELLAAKARAKGLALMTYVDPQVPKVLRGDPIRLRQILLNLGDNAIKFTEEGEVVIEARLAGWRDAQAVVRFSVRDTGIGIEPELKEALFEPFIQADGTTTRRFGGTGLGLSISKRLVEMMEGEIGVDSEPGKGSLFWFRVPFECAEAASASVPCPDDLAGVRVLVVDDNATACRILGAYLASWGIQSDAAAGSAEALAMLRQAAAAGTPYDIALIDLRMPEVDGLQLADMIRSDASLRSTRLILLTAFDAHGQGEEALRHGFSAYMTKPVKQSHLFDCIVNLLCADRPELKEHAAERRAAEAVATEQEKAKERPSRSGHVLVVEDNPVNRKVVMLQLENLGYDVDAVSNGAEAVEAVRTGRYDLILMDCQMPVMDGYQATQIIRKHEATTGRRIPIVALTANAMQGDREKCIGAGMDDYLSKPVAVRDLRAVLERWLPPAPGADGAVGEPEGSAAIGDGHRAQGPTAEDHAAWVAVDELLATYGPDETAVAKLLALYRTSAAKTMSELRAAIGERDGERARGAAHELKGASNMIGAYAMGEKALAVEEALKAGAWEKAERAFSELADVHGRTDGYLESVLAGWQK
ncbi:MAG: response regulator [Firmicutes bacterium]|nr:response regulator [Bacillota bacterium]